jgi:hypothetical protein
MQAKRSVQSTLDRVASGKLDKALGATFARPLDPGSGEGAAVRREFAGQRGFVKAEVMDMQVAPDGSHVSLRLVVPPEAIDFRSAEPVAFESLAINGLPVHEPRLQPPRSSVDSRGNPGFEFLISGSIEPTVARDLRSMTSLSLEGVFADGRFFAAMKA